MSDGNEFTSIFEEMLRLAQSLTGEQGFVRPETAAERPRPDELIEGREKLTYVLAAPGYEKDELIVSVLSDSLEVKGPDFLVRKELPADVDPDTARSKYLNGVLSVTLERRH